MWLIVSCLSLLLYWNDLAVILVIFGRSRFISMVVVWVPVLVANPQQQQQQQAAPHMHFQRWPWAPSALRGTMQCLKACYSTASNNSNTPSLVSLSVRREQSLLHPHGVLGLLVGTDDTVWESQPATPPLRYRVKLLVIGWGG